MNFRLSVEERGNSIPHIQSKGFQSQPNLSAPLQITGLKGFFICLLLMLSGGLSAQQVIVNKSVDDPSPPSGKQFVYTLEFGCSSLDADCLGAVMIDSLPLGIEFVSVDPVIIASSGGPVPVLGNYEMANHRIVWDFTTLPEGGLPDGVSGVVNVTVRTPAGEVPNNTPFTNKVDISSSNASSATATADIMVTSTVDWTLTKEVTSGTIYHDEDVTYEIEICPNSFEGNVNLTGATIADMLPPGATL